jgi:hypothetical protein
MVISGAKRIAASKNLAALLAFWALTLMSWVGDFVGVRIGFFFFLQGLQEQPLLQHQSQPKKSFKPIAIFLITIVNLDSAVDPRFLVHHLDSSSYLNQSVTPDKHVLLRNLGLIVNESTKTVS